MAIEQEMFVSRSFHVEIFETEILFVAQMTFQGITWMSMKHTFAGIG